MIDSIDLIIYDIEWIDFRYLRSLGIIIKGKVERHKMYWFKYKNITFKFYPTKKYLLIMTNTKDILEKKDTTLTDKIIYKEIVLKIIKEILNTNKRIGIYLSRIDYVIDIKCNDKEMADTYMDILKCCKTKYKYMKQKQKFKTSMYLKTKSGQFRLNFYNKYDESKKKEYENTLRLEIQVNPTKLKSERKRNGIPNILDAYWNVQKMEEIYFEMLKEYAYTGKYYKRKEINKRIEFSKYKKSYKEKLKKFVLMISRYGSQGIIDKKIYSRLTIKKYIEMLLQIEINPIPIPEYSTYDELNNLYDIAVYIAKSKYFK